MKYCKLYFILLSTLFIQDVNAQIVRGNTYAVIVGISNYESIGIRKLKFADKDALNFYNYLLSKSGGSVPEENIKLLLDEEASFAAIYQQLKWLLKKAKKDDLVYFYFSGHGDMENTTIYKLGFLLAQNTPRTNYINNALRIEDLNYYANTLSTKNEAKVVLITDACHSGDLAGNDFRGNQLVGNQLRAIQSNEVRITSCGPDELSAENAEWGDGSGIFSYYLLNGLKALADADKNGVVSLDEIDKFLKVKFAEDPILAKDTIKQNPVINGHDRNFTLAVIDKQIIDSVHKVFALAVAKQAPVISETERVQQLFFNKLKDSLVEDVFDFFKLDLLKSEIIPYEMIKQLAAGQQVKEDSQQLLLLDYLLHKDKDALAVFNDKLVALIHKRGQEILNLYLSGDEAELERRRYYNSNSKNYDEYPKMFSVAMKLTDPEDPFYKILKINKHYMAGLTLRLKVPLYENPATIIEQALAEQRAAYALEKNAAFILNELGILYQYKLKNAEAKNYYLEAIKISPRWALPRNNLAGLYAEEGKLESALAELDSAKQLNQDLQGIYSNAGYIQGKKENFLLAEDNFYKAIKLNSRHFYPFECLGYVYTNTTQYALADSFFYEADLRKRGYFFIRNPRLMNFPKILDVHPPRAPCFFDSANVKNNDVMGNFVWGLYAELLNNDAVTAERQFKKVIVLDTANPLVYHYLGKIFYAQQRWQEGEIYFNYATKYFLDSSRFQSYFDSLQAKLPQTNSRECIMDEFFRSQYNRIDDHYFLASLYENWNHFEDAEQQYRHIIKQDSAFIGGYYKRWSLFEKINRFKEAEDIIRLYSFQNKNAGNNELSSFYRRMHKRFPDNADWYYKAGIFSYNLAAEKPNGYKADQKIIEPDETEVKDKDPHATVMAAHPHEKFEYLPGTIEIVRLANPVNFPRADGIKFLLKADSLITDENALADINNKIGDLLVWQGLTEKSLAHYEKAQRFAPVNANIRMKLVENYSVTKKLADALAQLDSLREKRELNFTNQVLMATYCIHSGRFNDATVLLKEAQRNQPQIFPDFADLNGRLKLLSHKPKDAIVFYKKYLTYFPDDFNTAYTLAKLSAQTDNKADAWKWLSGSIDKGFNYSFVLRFDPVWEKYRKDAKWNPLMKQINQRVYNTGKSPEETGETEEPEE